ncbi:hypothetical protein LguiB_009869 [Lonicera macranthoides]
MPIGNELEEDDYDKQLKLQIDEIVYRILKLQLQKFVGQLGNIRWENSDDNTTDDTTDTGQVVRIVEILTGPDGSCPVAALHCLTINENFRLSLELHLELLRQDREINEKMLQQIDKVNSEKKYELDPNIVDLNLIHQVKMESTISTCLFLKFVEYHA